MVCARFFQAEGKQGAEFALDSHLARHEVAEAVVCVAGYFARLDGKNARKDRDYYADMGEERLIEIGQGLFLFFLHDEYTSRFRKMLTLEKYNNPALAALNAKRYIDDSLSYQGMLLGMLSEAGVLLPENPHIMALHFYSPLFLLLDLCDCCPEREPEALQLIEQHIRQFNRLYKKES